MTCVTGESSVTAYPGDFQILLHRLRLDLLVERLSPLNRQSRICSASVTYLLASTNLRNWPTVTSVALIKNGLVMTTRCCGRSAFWMRSFVALIGFDFLGHLQAPRQPAHRCSPSGTRRAESGSFSCRCGLSFQPRTQVFGPGGLAGFGRGGVKGATSGGGAGETAGFTAGHTSRGNRYKVSVPSLPFGVLSVPHSPRNGRRAKNGPR